MKNLRTSEPSFVRHCLEKTIADMISGKQSGTGSWTEKQTKCGHYLTA